MDETIPLAQRDTVIEDDSTNEEWDTFEESVKMLEPDDLSAIADRLGVEEQSDWEGYVKVFGQQYWSDYIEAYEHCMGRDFQ